MTSATTGLPAHAAGTFALGGDLTVHRMGFGAMRITGSGIWGPPADHGTALAVLRRAVERIADALAKCERESSCWAV